MHGHMTIVMSYCQPQNRTQSLLAEPQFWGSLILAFCVGLRNVAATILASAAYAQDLPFKPGEKITYDLENPDLHIYSL
jgi:hypothetical protein